MSRLRAGWVLISGLMLVACGHSPIPQFYLLNPMPVQKSHAKIVPNLYIGINNISIPSDLTKPQLMIHYTPHRVKLEEFHQWAGSLDKNIQQVIATNLMVLLPGAVVENVPWDIKFKPNYQLSIDISQFAVDINGNSTLRATYLIYFDDKVSKKGTVSYHQTICPVTIEALVASMNVHLMQLTQDIAQAVRVN